MLNGGICFASNEVYLLSWFEFWVMRQTANTSSCLESTTEFVLHISVDGTWLCVTTFQSFMAYTLRSSDVTKQTYPVSSFMLALLLPRILKQKITKKNNIKSFWWKHIDPNWLKLLVGLSLDVVNYFYNPSTRKINMLTTRQQTSGTFVAVPLPVAWSSPDSLVRRFPSNSSWNLRVSETTSSLFLRQLSSSVLYK